MPWLQLCLETDPAQVAGLEERLLAAGAVAVTLQDNADQPVLEPAPGETPLWNHLRLTALFPADHDMDAVLAALPAQDPGCAAPRMEILEDKDWEREWMRHYQPMRFGRRLWICPSWLSPPQPGAVNLMLDPGLAFGTGTHPTTALCLEQLDALPLHDARVVDYGCGSGILALAALKLGARQVLAVDNDPQALRASADNAGRNGIDPERLVVTLPGDAAHASWAGRADLVVANILAGPLAELAPTLLAFLRPGATLLLSGLLASQAQALCAHYAPQLRLATAAENDGWVCLRGEL
ncbi:MAG: 50S ribosomal protein L11 methyltransferase [Halioglobus sp.]|nr:50S ribosomal protein L11 methyltransferase [Halioglobus sp.]